MSKLISSQLIKISSVSSLRGDMHKYLKVVSPNNHNGIYAYFDQILIALDKNQIGRAKELCKERLELTPEEADIFICFSIMIAKDTMMGVRELWLKQENQKGRALLFQKLQDKLSDIIRLRSYYEKVAFNVAIATGKMQDYYKDDLDFSPESELLLQIAGDEARARVDVETYAATM